MDDKKEILASTSNQSKSNTIPRKVRKVIKQWDQSPVGITYHSKDGHSVTRHRIFDDFVSPDVSPKNRKVVKGVVDVAYGSSVKR